MKLLIYMLTLLCVAVTAPAQEANVAVAPAPVGEAVSSYYDEMVDETTTSVVIAVLMPMRGQKSVLELDARFTYKGRQPIAVANVQVFLKVPCDMADELRNDPVFCGDGLCEAYRPRLNVTACGGKLDKAGVSRMVDIPEKKFRSLVGSDQIKVRLFSTEIELAEEQCQALRNLAGYMPEGAE